MRFSMICAFILALAVGSISGLNGDGRPGCKNQKEITDKIYRNFWDSTAYWVCSELNVPASPARCPDEELFLFSARKCVPYDEWLWEKPIAPLSQP